mgnify:CR=1 FL=1
MKHFVYGIIFIILTSCGQDYIKSEPQAENMKVEEPKIISETFDDEIITSLYEKLDAEFEIPFKQNHLEKFLKNRNILHLKEGKEFEKQILFEDFDCTCYDKLNISYSDNRFFLDINVQLFVKELDWCPESTYSYSFQIVNHKITDLKLEFMAG